MNYKSFQDHFPIAEDFIDSAGKPRQFQISLYKMVGGDCRVEAIEVAAKDGYRFDVYSPITSDPAIGSALGKLRGKIRKLLSTRYLRIDGTGTKSLTHDELRGQISSGGIVVDGSLLRFDDLASILQTHEGFQIRIHIGE